MERSSGTRTSKRSKAIINGSKKREWNKKSAVGGAGRRNHDFNNTSILCVGGRIYS
jgi:hypothetical protein